MCKFPCVASVGETGVALQSARQSVTLALASAEALKYI